MNKFRLLFLFFITVFLCVTGGLGRIYTLDGAGYVINALVSAIIAHSLVEAILDLSKGDK
jgi:hypothetical protein